MENRITGKLGLSFSLNKGRLLIYHATIQELGSPSRIRFLHNVRDRKLAIQCCDPVDRDSFEVPEYEPGEKYQFELYSAPFLTSIYRMCRWDKNETYRVYGISHPEYRLVEFYLDQAQQIRPEEFVDPENAELEMAEVEIARSGAYRTASID